MEKLTRRRYALEHKLEAVRLVASGQKAAAAKALGIVEQAQANRVKAEKAGRLRGVQREQAGAERMENSRPRAEPARATMERDILRPANEDLFAGARSGKSGGALREGAAMKYAWIEKNKLRRPACAQCRVLGVSASGCRQHRARKKKILTRRHRSSATQRAAEAGGLPALYLQQPGHRAADRCRRFAASLSLAA
jgi:transposase